MIAWAQPSLPFFMDIGMMVEMYQDKTGLGTLRVTSKEYSRWITSTEEVSRFNIKQTTRIGQPWTS